MSYSISFVSFEYDLSLPGPSYIQKLNSCENIPSSQDKSVVINFKSNSIEGMKIRRIAYNSSCIDWISNLPILLDANLNSISSCIFYLISTFSQLEISTNWEMINIYVRSSFQWNRRWCASSLSRSSILKIFTLNFYQYTSPIFSFYRRCINDISISLMGEPSSAMICS
jgi:hypothetical protein